MIVGRQALALLAVISSAVRVARERAVARQMLRLDDERLADIGLTRRDIQRAIGSMRPFAVMDAARDRNSEGPYRRRCRSCG
ncbi:MAG: DUF1127 domain-containing protein [Hyphomicrobiaceae bacterium]